MILSFKLTKKFNELDKDLFKKITDIKVEGKEYFDIAMSDDTKISFVPEDRFIRFGNEDYWNADLRKKFAQMTTITKLLSPYLSYDECTILQNLMSDIKDEYELVEVVGEDIRKYYHENTYEERTGSLIQSCMRYSACQDYFDLYVKNPNKIRMLISRNKQTGLINGRALIWVCEEDVTLLDRIYGTDQIVSRFKQYAKIKGYYSKYSQATVRNNVDDNDDDDNHLEPYHAPNGKTVNKSLYAELDNWKFHTYPYLDTMRYFARGDNSKGLFSNDCGDPYDHECNSTEGNGPFEILHCTNCGDEMFEDGEDSYHSNNGMICRHCREASYIYSAYEDLYYHRNSSSVRRCFDCGTYFHYRDGRQINNHWYCASHCNGVVEEEHQTSTSTVTTIGISSSTNTYGLYSTALNNAVLESSSYSNTVIQDIVNMMSFLGR